MISKEVAGALRHGLDGGIRKCYAMHQYRIQGYLFANCQKPRGQNNPFSLLCSAMLEYKLEKVSFYYYFISLKVVHGLECDCNKYEPDSILKQKS